MSTRRDILQAVRSVLIAAAELDGAKVIPANDRGPRPAPPYLTVNVPSWDVQVGDDELVDVVVEGAPAVYTRGQRSAMVSVNAYGEQGVAWLEQAVARLRLPSVQTVIDEAGLTVVPIGGPNDVSRMLDTAFEVRAQRDLEVAYAVVTDPEGVSELLTAELSRTFEGDPALIDTHTVTL